MELLNFKQGISVVQSLDKKKTFKVELLSISQSIALSNVGGAIHEVVTIWYEAILTLLFTLFLYHNLFSDHNS